MSRFDEFEEHETAWTTGVRPRPTRRGVVQPWWRAPTARGEAAGVNPQWADHDPRCEAVVPGRVPRE